MDRCHRSMGLRFVRTLVTRYHVSCSLDDLPKRAFGAVVIDAAAVVRALLFEHAEADQAAEFLGHVSLQDHFGRIIQRASLSRHGRPKSCLPTSRSSNVVSQHRFHYSLSRI